MKAYLITLISICIMTVNLQAQENNIDSSDPDIVKCDQIKGITSCYDNKGNKLKEIDWNKGSIKHFTSRKIIHNSYYRMEKSFEKRSIGSIIIKHFMYKKKTFNVSIIERGLAEGYYIYEYDEYGEQSIVDDYFLDPKKGEVNSFDDEEDVEGFFKEFDSINALNPQPITYDILVYDKRDKDGYPLERKTTWGNNIELIKVNYHIEENILHYKNYVNDVLFKEYIMEFNEQGLVVNSLDFVYDGTDFYDREQPSHYWFKKMEYNKKGYLIRSVDYDIKAFNQIIKLRKEKGDTCFFEIMFQGNPEEYMVLEQSGVVTKQYNRKNNIIEVNTINSVTNKIEIRSKIKYDYLDRIEEVIVYRNQKKSEKTTYEY